MANEKLKELKKNLEEIELFEDCISTRDTDEDVEEFKGYVKKCFEAVKSLEEELKAKTTEDWSKGVIGTARIGFWKSFGNDLRDSKDLNETQSFYNGYAIGLLKSTLITQEQYDEVIQRIKEKITWTKTKKRYSLKED